jgi:xylan 1,4-beta-xylosidase
MQFAFGFISPPLRRLATMASRRFLLEDGVMRESVFSIALSLCLLFIFAQNNSFAENSSSTNSAEWSPTTNYRSVVVRPTSFDAVVLKADAKASGQLLVHFWSVCVGAGRANEGLRASWQEQLATVHDYCGFQYVRFHGLFHNDMFVYRNGVENWQYVDELFDRMLAMHVRPFVELGFNPFPLSESTTPVTSVADRVQKNPGWTQFWWQGNVTPPEPLKWAAFITDVTKHIIDRYGQDEVRQWFFEVWNEPNLDQFYRRGTQAQYFELFKATILAMKKIDPQLRVGGPATSNYHVHGVADVAGATPDDVEALNWQPIWVQDFMQYCKDESLPLDFISTHPYPTNFQINDGGERASVRRAIESTQHDLMLLRNMVNASPFPRAGIYLTEWSSSPNSRDFMHDCICPAAFIAKTNLDSLGLVDALSYWTFTDVFEEHGAGDTIFHGGFGLINYQGIPKPAFHAYRMLNALGDEVIARGPAGIVSRHSSSGKITALAYLYPPEVRESLRSAGSMEAAKEVEEMGHTMPLSIELKNLPEGAEFSIETLDQSHGYALALYRSMGMPNPPTREQVAQLKQAAWGTMKETMRADDAGCLSIRRTIAPWSLVLIDQQ